MKILVVVLDVMQISVIIISRDMVNYWYDREL